MGVDKNEIVFWVARKFPRASIDFCAHIGYTHFSICNDHILSNLGILVNDAIPSKKKKTKIEKRRLSIVLWKSIRISNTHVWLPWWGSKWKLFFRCTILVIFYTCTCVSVRERALTWFLYSVQHQLEPCLPQVEMQFQIQFDSSLHPSS